MEWILSRSRRQVTDCWRIVKVGYELEFEDTFDGEALDEGRWIAHYLPHWSSRADSAARYEIGGGALRLLIEADQKPWCPELDGEVRVSSLQTGVFAGPGRQHRRSAPVQPGSGRPGVPAERPALHASVRPH